MPKRYPAIKNVDVFFENYEKLSAQEKRVEYLKSFLDKLSNPADVSDDQCLQYFIDKLNEEYIASEDEAILIAVDQTRIDGGFANFICSFYKSIEGTEGFRNRYIANGQNRDKIERCAGISFDSMELNAANTQ